MSFIDTLCYLGNVGTNPSANVEEWRIARLVNSDRLRPRIESGLIKSLDAASEPGFWNAVRQAGSALSDPQKTAILNQWYRTIHWAFDRGGKAHMVLTKDLSGTKDLLFLIPDAKAGMSSRELRIFARWSESQGNFVFKD